MTIQNIKKTTLRSQDLNCPSCVAKIENKLSAINGVQDATVHFTTGRIVVNHDRENVSVDELVKAVESVGYKAKASAF